MDPTCARSLFVGKQLIRVTFTVLLKLGFCRFCCDDFSSILNIRSLWPHLKRWENGQICSSYFCFFHRFRDFLGTLFGAVELDKSNRGTYCWMEECNLILVYRLVQCLFFLVPPTQYPQRVPWKKGRSIAPRFIHFFSPWRRICLVPIHMNIGQTLLVDLYSLFEYHRISSCVTLVYVHRTCE